MNNSGKTRGCLIAVIVFLLIVILIMTAIYFIFFVDRSDMPDVSQFISKIENTERTTDNNSSITDIINIRPDSGGSSIINITLTNADLTALSNDTVDSNDSIPIEDLLFNCNADETIDVTGVLTDLSVYVDNTDVPSFVKFLLSSTEGKRIYATVFIDYVGNNEFDIDIENIKIDKLNIPMLNSIFDPMAENIGIMLKEQLEANAGFKMQDFLIEEGRLVFSGTITE